MADDWHVRWLAEGVLRWNRRRKKVKFRPDLSGIRFFDFLPADFRDSPKTSRYFERIDLSDADLRGADLSGMNFAKGNFSSTNLSECSMSLSNFSYADFKDADLTGADATNSLFIGAEFDHSILLQAKFADSNADNAMFLQSQVSQQQLTELASSSFHVFERPQELLEFRQSQALTAKGPPVRREAKKVEDQDKPKPKNRYDVFFGTNRAPIIERGAVTDFGESISQLLSFGVCEVIIPDGHRIGSLGSPLWKRIFSRKDDRLKLDALVYLNDTLFWEHIRQSTAEMRVKERPTIFVHGYNTSFTDAVLRAAQIGFDLGIGQGVGLFSWPSKGSTKNYLADEAASESSKYALADFIERFVAESEQKSINLIAYSMGCRCALNAIEVLANGRRGVLSKLNQVIMAAADVDSNLMPNLGKYTVSYSKRTTSYVCEDDIALKVSGWLHGYSRVGFRPPTFVFGGMDTIVVNDKDLGNFSYGYVGSSRAVLNDVFMLLKGNTPPAERFSVEHVLDGEISHWRIRD